MLKLTLRFIHNKTAASGPLPIERALKTDVLSILAAYQQLYSNTINKKMPTPTNTSNFFYWKRNSQLIGVELTTYHLANYVIPEI